MVPRHTATQSYSPHRRTGTVLLWIVPSRVVSAQPRRNWGKYRIGTAVPDTKAAPDMSIDLKQASPVAVDIAVVADAFVFDTVEVDMKCCTNFAAL